MRYFLVSFNPDNKLGFGSIILECEDFFSHSFLLESVQKQDPTINNVVPLFIFEFRTKADYQAYIKEI